MADLERQREASILYHLHRKQQLPACSGLQITVLGEVPGSLPKPAAGLLRAGENASRGATSGSSGYEQDRQKSCMNVTIVVNQEDDDAGGDPAPINSPKPLSRVNPAKDGMSRGLEKGELVSKVRLSKWNSLRREIVTFCTR